jgi:Domain of unknown function (DUF6916)
MLPDELYSRRLTWDDAQHLAGEPVELIADEAKPVATLMTVASVEIRSAGDPFQFAIVFHGPPGTVLEQRTYRFRHRRLGEYAIFITAIAHNPTATEYEACFTSRET